MKRKNYVHCPKPGCDAPLRGSWSDYLTGEKHPKTGLPVYQCPNCGLKFTADAFKANAVPVPDGDSDIIIYDTTSNHVIDIIPHEMKFTDGQFSYIHLPISVCTNQNLRCFAFKAKGMPFEEIERTAREALTRKDMKVLR